MVKTSSRIHKIKTLPHKLTEHREPEEEHGVNGAQQVILK